MTRINKWIALHTVLSRRSADTAVENGRVTINGQKTTTGDSVNEKDTVTLDGEVVWTRDTPPLLVMLNKPVGYVCSRNGQGSKTVYDLLPRQMHTLKPVGRLDKDSSGLLLLTDDGALHHELTHPSFQKEKRYIVELNKRLSGDELQILNRGVMLDDGKSLLNVRLQQDGRYVVSMKEGRNRQIRRTFAAVGATVVGLHRVAFGPYRLGTLSEGSYKEIAR